MARIERLVRIEIAPGRFVKVRPQDARRFRPAERKVLLPQENKAVPDPDDDLTQVPGIGPATAEMLREKGIRTLRQLRTADLMGITSARVRAAIDAWRDSEVG